MLPICTQSSKQIGMAAGMCEHEGVAVDMPDEKPVGLDMAFP